MHDRGTRILFQGNRTSFFIRKNTYFTFIRSNEWRIRWPRFGWRKKTPISKARRIKFQDQWQIQNSENIKRNTFKGYLRARENRFTKNTSEHVELVYANTCSPISFITINKVNVQFDFGYTYTLNSRTLDMFIRV